MILSPLKSRDILHWITIAEATSLKWSNERWDYSLKFHNDPIFEDFRKLNDERMEIDKQSYPGVRTDNMHIISYRKTGSVISLKLFNQISKSSLIYISNFPFSCFITI